MPVECNTFLTSVCCLLPFFPSSIRLCLALICKQKECASCLTTYQSNVFYLHTGLDKYEFGECTYAYRKPLNSSRHPSLSQYTIRNYVLCKLQSILPHEYTHFVHFKHGLALHKVSICLQVL